jgi:glutaredoxin/glutathione-dependent peroxiredoxin
MTITEGSRLPDATLLTLGPEGPEPVVLTERLKGRKVVIFGMPGAFTRTCHSAHMPSLVRTAAEFAARGVDEVICIAVNDPFVMHLWGESTGAAEAGITMLADPETAFTAAIGMEYSAPPAGLIRRSRRYGMVVEDGIVTALQVEQARGSCEMSGGEALLARL